MLVSISRSNSLQIYHTYMQRTTCSCKLVSVFINLHKQRMNYLLINYTFYSLIKNKNKLHYHEVDNKSKRWRCLSLSLLNSFTIGDTLSWQVNWERESGWVMRNEANRRGVTTFSIFWRLVFRCCFFTPLPSIFKPYLMSGIFL